MFVLKGNVFFDEKYVINDLSWLSSILTQIASSDLKSSDFELRSIVGGEVPVKRVTEFNEAVLKSDKSIEPEQVGIQNNFNFCFLFDNFNHHFI